MKQIIWIIGILICLSMVSAHVTLSEVKEDFRVNLTGEVEMIERQLTLENTNNYTISVEIDEVGDIADIIQIEKNISFELESGQKKQIPITYKITKEHCNKIFTGGFKVMSSNNQTGTAIPSNRNMKVMCSLENSSKMPGNTNIYILVMLILIVLGIVILSLLKKFKGERAS